MSLPIRPLSGGTGAPLFGARRPGKTKKTEDPPAESAAPPPKVRTTRKRKKAAGQEPDSLHTYPPPFGAIPDFGSMGGIPGGPSDEDEAAAEAAGKAAAKERAEKKLTRFFENAVPVDTTEGQQYRHYRPEVAQHLAQVLTRHQVHHAVLQYSDERLRQGVILGLQEQLGSTPLLEVDFDKLADKDEQPDGPGRKGFPLKALGGMMTSILPRIMGMMGPQAASELMPKAMLDEIMPAVQKAIAETRARHGLGPDQPLVITLRNVPPEVAVALTSTGIVDHLHKVDPNLRLILQTPQMDDAQDKLLGTVINQFSQAFGKNLQGMLAPPWRQGNFEVVTIPPLKPHEQANLMLADPKVMALAQFHKLNMTPDGMVQLIQTLNNHYERSLSPDELHAELDAFGAFAKARHAPDTPIDGKDIAEYARTVLRKRPTAGAMQTGDIQQMLLRKAFEVIPPGAIKETLKDVVGLDGAKGIIRSVLDEQDDPELHSLLDGTRRDPKPTGILLSGPPGNGKTTLARAVAGEGKATFIKANVSDFLQMFVGSGTAKVDHLKDAIESAPGDLVVVFLEEIDGLGQRSKGQGLKSGGINGSVQNERDNTINKMLDMLDGVTPFNKRVIFIGATNRPKTLDGALKQRFQHHITVGKPEAAQRKLLFAQELKKFNMTLAPDVTLEALADQTEGLAGREIYSIVENVKTAKKARLQVPAAPPSDAPEGVQQAYQRQVAELGALRKRLKTDPAALAEFLQATAEELTQAIQARRAQLAQKKQNRPFGFAAGVPQT